MAQEMTLLEIVQEFCRRRGLPVPVSAMSATDDTTQQMVGLLNEGIQDITDRYYYQNLIQTAKFYHVKGPNHQGVPLTSYPDYKAFVRGTFWNTTDKVLVDGPLTPQQWQQLIVMDSAPATYSFRFYQNAAYIYPTPESNGPIFSFEYLSRYGVWDPAESKSSEFYTTDDSHPRIPSYVVLADLKWRWERDRGFPYAEDQRTCEEMLTNLVGREPGQDLDMAYTPGEVTPGLYVAAGSWPL